MNAITTKYAEAYNRILHLNISFDTLEEGHKEFLKLYVGYNCNKNLLINKQYISIIENYIKEHASKAILNMARGYHYAKRFDKTGDRYPNDTSIFRLQSYFRLLLYKDAVKNNFGEDYLLTHELFKSESL